MRTLNRFSQSLLLTSLLGTLAYSASGCAEETISDEAFAQTDESQVAEATTNRPDKADRPAIATTELDIPDLVLPASADRATRRLFTSAASFKAYFGSNAPASINWSRDWILFYSAGRQSTGGYDALILNVALSNSGSTLKVTTRLSKPGSNCRVSRQLTRPFVLAKFRKPAPRPNYVSYYRSDITEDCQPEVETDFCESVTCGAGTHCEVSALCTGDHPACCIPDADPCTALLCGPGTRCEVNAAPCAPGMNCPVTASCVPNTAPPVNPCFAALCAPGTRCTVVSGSARCVSIN